MRLALIDNYDSFTFNLVHYLEMNDCIVEVFRNDAVEIQDLESFEAIVLSPGPNLPKNAGKMMDIIQCYYKSKKILGICLGMQGIGEFFGAKLINLSRPFHGVSSAMQILDKKDPIFSGLPNVIEIGRYHSWILDNHNFPKSLKILGSTNDNHIMLLKHELYNIYGLQFHPESILTPFGKQLISNWIKI